MCCFSIELRKQIKLCLVNTFHIFIYALQLKNVNTPVREKLYDMMHVQALEQQTRKDTKRPNKNFKHFFKYLLSTYSKIICLSFLRTEKKKEITKPSILKFSRHLIMVTELQNRTIFLFHLFPFPYMHTNTCKYM